MNQRQSSFIPTKEFLLESRRLAAFADRSLSLEKAYGHPMTASSCAHVPTSFLRSMSIVELLAAESVMQEQRDLEELQHLRNRMAARRKLDSLRAIAAAASPPSTMSLLSAMNNRLSAASISHNTMLSHKYSDNYHPSFEDKLQKVTSGFDSVHPSVLEKSTEKPRRRPKKASATAVSFPTKLLQMLHYAESEGLDDVISFLPHGKSFMIHKPEEFVNEIMPKFFKTGRMSSFHRQLNLYGFKRITFGQDMGAFYHESFQRDDQELSASIQRKRQRVPDGEPVGQWVERAAVLKGLSVATGPRFT